MATDPSATYRPADLAAAAGISISLLRSYQSKGLLPPPRHQGRDAFYDDTHLERLLWIRDLKSRGYSLQMIHSAVLSESGAPATRPTGLEPPPATALRLREVADRSGVPAELLRAIEASQLLRPHRVGRTYRYSDADVTAVRRVLTLLGVGMPLEEFLGIADPALAAIDELSTRAVEVWMRQFTARVRDLGGNPDDFTDRVVASLRLMVSAVAGLVAYNVERAILNEAQAALHRTEDEVWGEAVANEVLRRHPDVAAG